MQMTRRGLLLTTALGASLAASATHAMEPVRGGTMVMIVQPEPSTLAHCMVSAGNIPPIATQVYEGLVTYDWELNPVPNLAKSWDIAPDGRTITFHLQDGVQFLASHPAGATLEQLAAAIEARWGCEQAHRQLKEELGLDHFEGRSWRGLHHHALLCQVAHAFLQSLRAGRKRQDAPDQADAPAPPGPPPRPTLPEARRHVVASLLDHLSHCSNCGHRTPWHMLV